MLELCIIDDEPLVLKYLDFLLHKIDGVQVRGKYSDPKDLINHARHQHINVAFMDIQLPGMTGIDLAEQLLNIQPSLHIVFVTGYNEYAVKAFELNALDYIMKPVKEERLRAAINRIKERSNTPSVHKASSADYSIKNLGALHIYRDGHPIEVKWRTLKIKELFAYLVQHHERSIPKSELTNLLWQNLSWEKGHSQLYSAVYQIRKMVEYIGIPLKIVSQDEFYRIDMSKTQVQSNEWKISALLLLEANDVSIHPYLELLTTYSGHYLEDMQQSWVLEKRNDIRNIWFQLINHVIEYISHHEEEAVYTLPKLQTLVKLDDEAVSLVQNNLNR
ncbi:response regulator [Gracilibacillus alcaliphilus]|uniref:response regulator n=1 Tax=Gracilibacillus alcaliphilus TaxID=1401441 RepID=UPI00195B4B59|nr:response regulator [Gracilibacillus alcaliphilus]MBM7678026.1 two-component SAPR family response regulator [Gracilibacillus alcaliphilus]